MLNEDQKNRLAKYKANGTTNDSEKEDFDNLRRLVGEDFNEEEKTPADVVENSNDIENTDETPEVQRPRKTRR